MSATHPQQTPGAAESLSALILTRNEAESLDALLPLLSEALADTGLPFEIVVVDAASPDGTATVAARHGARVVLEAGRGYANALRQGFAACSGDFVLTLDADMSHHPSYVAALLDARGAADVVIASRYVASGGVEMPAYRKVLSFVLNRVFAAALGLPTKDMSSGFRLYRRAALAELAPRGEHFDVLPEIVALAHMRGLRVREVPFQYHPRSAGASKARVLEFVPSYLQTIWRCFRERPHFFQIFTRSAQRRRVPPR
jgi:dolichol-phosphate mannosyltransferase